MNGFQGIGKGCGCDCKGDIKFLGGDGTGLDFGGGSGGYPKLYMK